MPQGVQLVAFTDDVCVLGISRNGKSTQTLINPVLEAVAEWMNTNGLQLLTKCNNTPPSFVIEPSRLFKNLASNCKHIDVKLRHYSEEDYKFIKDEITKY